MQIADERQDVFSGSAVEVTRRFVGQQDWGVHRQRARDRDALPLTAGQFFRQMRKPIAELHQRQQLARARVDLAARPPAQVKRQADVFQARQRRQQVEELENETDLVASHLRQLVVMQAGERLAVDQHIAGGGTVEATHQVEECRFAGSRLTDDRYHLAARDRQRDLVERGDAPLALKALGGAIELNHSYSYRTLRVMTLRARSHTCRRYRPCDSSVYLVCFPIFA